MDTIFNWDYSQNLYSRKFTDSKLKILFSVLFYYNIQKLRLIKGNIYYFMKHINNKKLVYGNERRLKILKAS